MSISSFLKKGQILALALMSVFTMSASSAVAAPMSVTQQCTAHVGSEFSVGWTKLIYTVGGNEQIRHEFIGFVSQDTVSVKTSVPNGLTYIQHIHLGSRQVVFTSEPINERTRPGMLPQSDYTDLWISPSVQVGQYVSIQNIQALVGQVDENNIYVGPNSGQTKAGARVYDKVSGIYKGINTAGAVMLSGMKPCETTPEEPEEPEEPTEVSFDASGSVSSTLPLGEEATINIVVENNGASVSGPIINLEIYNTQGAKVHQEFVDMTQVFASNTERNFAFKWTPNTTGEFRIALGVFGDNWNGLLHWENMVVPNVTVTDGGQQTGEGDIELEDAYMTTTTDPGTLHGVFGTDDPPSEESIIDLEIYNKDNQKVSQKFFEDVVIPDEETIEKTIDIPENLPDGDYTFKVGIFAPMWQSLRAWYGNALQFTLGGEEPQEEGVSMISSDLDPETVDEGETSTFSATFESMGVDKDVLLNIELYNENNEKVAQEYFNDVTLVADTPLVRMMETPNDLAPGEYTFHVGIFNPDWNGLLKWYSNVETLTVEEGEQTEDGVSMTSSTLDFPVIDEGETSTLSAEFTSAGDDADVLIDFELYNESHERVAQEYFDDVSLLADTPVTRMMETSPTLTPGQYTFQVGIFNTGWSGLLKWYPNVATLTVE